jgi:D-glycero-alpha-D-manno-heptose 1-phosphate guanylyltransferase
VSSGTSRNPEAGRWGDVPCLILVGGLGTRLRPVLTDIPKPMARVADKPFLEYLIRWVGRAGCRQIVLCAGYGARQIKEYFGQGNAFGVQLRYSVEDEPLGTWGAIRLAGGQISSPHFVVLNGDSWLQVDLCRLLEFHRQRKGVLSVAAVEVDNSSRFGSIRLDRSGRVTEFVEKRGEGAALVNGGVYAFSREVFEVTGSTKAGSLEREILPALMPQGVYGMHVKGYFVDIGVPEAYRRLLSDARSWIEALEFQNANEGEC